MAGLIDYSIIKPELANALATGFQKAQERQQTLAEQGRQNKLADLQLRGAQRGEEEALLEREAYKNQDPLAALRAAGLNKQALAYQKTVDEQTAAKLKQATDIHKLVSDSLRGVAALGTRESAQGALANAKAAGLNVAQYEAELAQTPDALISKWALSHAAGADKALEQQFVDLGIGTVAGPKYATGSPTAQPTAPFTGGIPAGIPGQTPGSRVAGTNALALPTPGGAMPAAQPYAVPGGGMMYPKGMSQAQTATDRREQQRIALEQRRVDLAEKEAQHKTQQESKPVFNAAAGGFISPPTKDKPQGEFIPATDIQTSKDQQAAIKALQSAGYDPVTGEDKISKLISKSTSGGLQAAGAATLSFLGKTTEGRKAISALEGTANQIATDLAGGKLGAGISNTDREFIVGALGDVSNPMKTAEERLAGWTAAKERMMRVGLIPAPKSGKPAAPAAPAAPSNIDALLDKYK